MATNGHGERVPGWSIAAIALAAAGFAVLPVVVSGADQAVTTAAPVTPASSTTVPPAPPPSAPLPAPTAPPPTTARPVTLADELHAFDASIPQSFLTDLELIEPTFREIQGSTTREQFQARTAAASRLITRMVQELDHAVTGQMLRPRITALKNSLGGVAMGLQAVSTCEPGACDRPLSVLDAAGERLADAADDLLALYNSTPF